MPYGEARRLHADRCKIVEQGRLMLEECLNSRKLLTFFKDAGTMKKIIVSIIIIIAMGCCVHAMKPYYGSVINQWDRQFELGRGIDHYVILGKEKPTTLELSRLPKSAQPYRPANLDEVAASKETAHFEQNTIQKASSSGGNSPQISFIEAEEPAALMEFHRLSSLAQNFMNLPCEEEFFRSSDVWRSIGTSPRSCGC